ncbi:MAG: sugar transferase [Cognatishimia sp.]|uniref:sugar transferase n=1 Tax=Cognatishimia sp. TaxID=2211648 RepID=UPI003B8B34A9
MAYFDRRELAPTQYVSRTAPGLYRSVLKRILDLAAVAVLALPVFLVIAVLAVFVAKDGKSPFYIQKRVGKNGREFSMLKLRSMVPNAESVLQEYLSSNAEARAEWDEKQKLLSDPRITPIGHMIRKTSLDELPQLWNVLRGEMSLVGPRPMMPCQQELYPGVSYYEMRPGITGLWQVSERNETSFAQRAQYDNRYHRELSFRSDVSVMLKTVEVVLRAKGC